MISPYVRRLRLAAELKALRESRGLTHDQLAKSIGQSRQQISRLENGHVAPHQDDVMLILEHLGVTGGEAWSNLMTIATEAAFKGWWESSARAMGPRQALFANLEGGAKEVFEYQQSFFPGLVQTQEFTLARIDAEWVPDPAGVSKPNTDGIIRGRAGRQRWLHRDDGPAYEAILDEVVVRRLSAPPEVMRGQLLHLLDLADREKVTLRLLPVEARITGYCLPVCSFSFYRYPDPGDPVVVAVETVTSDLILTEQDQSAAYTDMYDRLRDAALPVVDGLDVIKQAADRLS